MVEFTFVVVVESLYGCGGHGEHPTPFIFLTVLLNPTRMSH